MASTTSKKKVTPLSDQEIQAKYTQFQSDLQAVASKIGELEAEADEHSLVLNTLTEALQEDPDRKCFRLIGGVLVERTVKNVVPALQTNRDGIHTAVKSLASQYEAKEKEFDTFKQDYKIRVVGRE